MTASGDADARLTGECAVCIFCALLQLTVCLVSLHLGLYLSELYFERDHLLAGRLHFIRRTAKELYFRL